MSDQREGDVYDFLGVRFDLAGAWEVAETLTPQGSLNVIEFYKQYLIAYDSENLLPMFGLPAAPDDTDPTKWAMRDEVDTDTPVLIAAYRIDDESNPAELVIDGWGRIYKAYHIGQQTIPAIRFTVEQCDPFCTNQLYDMYREKKARRIRLLKALQGMLDNEFGTFWREFGDDSYDGMADELREMLDLSFEAWNLDIEAY